MNKDWIDFLKSNGSDFLEKSPLSPKDSQESYKNSISPLMNFASIKISGNDAVHFLQGQLTCNINELNNSNSYLAAFCNAKGRTLSTLLVLKIDAGFLLLLPTELEEKVSSKLRMYILRSDVQVTSATDELCLFGLTSNDKNITTHLPESNFAISRHSEIIIKFPSELNRYLFISPLIEAKSLWSEFIKQNLSIAHPDTWAYQDISAGIPWLTKATSEAYIPQMLNIDKLGGISFNKGCYTGQEIIARTHYLGKAKRELFLAECHITAMLETDIQIISKNSEKSVGKVICAQNEGQKTRMLIVIATNEAESSDLNLDNKNQDKISIIDYQ